MSPPQDRQSKLIADQLFRMDWLSQRAGLGLLSPQDLQRAHQRIVQGVQQALTQRAPQARPGAPPPMGQLSQVR